MKEFIEIPFGAKDSELGGWEYNIPDGMEATIVDNKIVVKKKESEDERIRKTLLGYFNDQPEQYTFRGLTNNEVIAWLEKQGKYKFEHGDDNATKVFKNEDGTHSNISQLERVAKKVTETEETAKEFLKSAEIINENGELAEEYRLEKQGEPKFKVGDWVARGNVKAQIIGIEDNKYCFDGYNVRCSTIDKHYHLWTIQDAKDGDVLVASDSSIFIFKEVDDNSCKHYIALTSDKVIKINVGLKHYWETARGVKPATKEQRDLLFKKIKKAGYEWDAEKKELNKIEQKPTDKVEQNMELTDFESALFTAFSDAWQQYLDGEEVNVAQWAKEHSTELLEVARKEHVKWSEEDEKHRNAAICACSYMIENFENSTKIYEDANDWLKSLKPQPQWKPSEEQIKDFCSALLILRLQHYVSVESLESLYEQLKKL